MIRKIGDERALAMLAEEAVVRTVGRGGIAFAGARFVAIPLATHGGAQVMVFPDPSGNMGRIFVFQDVQAGGAGQGTGEHQ